MKKVFLTLAASILILAGLQAQTGEIQGRVVDQNGDGIPFASVAVYLNNVLVNGTATDYEGYFSIKPLDPGKYRVSASYIGKVVNVTGVVVSSGKTTFLDNIKINTAQEIGPVTVVYEAPPVDVGKPDAGDTKTREEIEKMPKNDLVGIIGNSAATYQADDNNLINIAGSRGYATKYILDGVDLTGIVELPTEAINQIQIITGGIEAKQGDLTGGIVNISTRGPSRDFHGALEALTSQYLDPFGYNQLRFSALGPVYTRYKGTDSSQTVLGFLFTGEFLYKKDNDPPATPLYQVKDSVLQEIKQNPLRPSSFGTGLSKSSEYLHADDLYEIKYKPNNWLLSGSFFGKLDFKPSRSINVTLGGQYYYRKRRAYVRTFSLMNAENNPLVINNDIRAYAKFTQRFMDKLQNKEEGSTSGYQLANAFYTIQLDYQRSTSSQEDPRFGWNPFLYGYIGKFHTYRAPVYAYGMDSLTGNTGFRLLGYSDTAVTFEPGTANPLMSRYTEMYYETEDPVTLAQVLLGGGLRNGDFTQNQVTYSMYYNPGVPWFNYGKSDNQQFGMRFDASVDLKKSSGDRINKHALEFGFEYQQRIERSYYVSPISLWELMRQNANFHLNNLDISKPYYLINGDTILYSDFTGQLGQYDTIFYFPRYSQADQKYFDIQLRRKLGLPVNSLEWIDIDAIDPDFFSLDMFSPDELIQDGNRLVSTRGYDYYGNKLKRQPAFSDFFLKFADLNGNGVKDFDEYYTRDLGAYEPIYTGVYVQDKFNIGRVIFRVGLRVDRFDANQKVLKDKYSLYPIRTVAEVDQLAGNPVTHPGNIGSDYAVYVNDIQNPTEIVGYRKGDTWYNSTGAEIFDPAVLAAQTSTGKISPYLVDPTMDIKDPNTFDPNLSFVDYDPQYTVMPRIAFSFPITETAMFTAHYDVLTQRPLSRNEATPYHYYFLQEIAIDGVIPNPDLKPEKTINYELGFQQALSDHSALKISAFYKELRDMMQVMQVNYAYPVNYTTYGNIDFGTVKGLTLTYDLIRRVNNTLMTAAYTLQFADGTGSGTTSQINLIGAGQPNLRTILPLNYDVRHTFNINLDYRFPAGDEYNGPVVGGRDILSNAGINIVFRARSGEPYTRQNVPTPTAMFGVRTQSALEGTINGSRLPWNFKIDARLDKDFAIGSKDHPRFVNVYILVQNLLNAKNILSVYAYTGDPRDDGFLDYPASSETLAGQVDPQSFIDLYTIKMHNPDKFSLPRRIQFGVKLKF